MNEAVRLARGDDALVDVHSVLDRNKELIPQLPNVSNARALHTRVPDVDLTRRPEGESSVAHIDARQLREESAGVRPLQVDLCKPPRNVGDVGLRPIVIDSIPHQRLDVAVHCIRCDDHELGVLTPSSGGKVELVHLSEVPRINRLYKIVEFQ